MMSIGLHPRWAGQAGRTSGLREFIEYALEHGDVWFARRIDIAAGGSSTTRSSSAPSARGQVFHRHIRLVR